MASQNQSHEETGHTHGSLKSYIIGFVLSIILTIIPLVAVLNDLFNRSTTIAVILVTAALQFLVQLIFFMHIREEDKPRYNLISLIFAVLILLTIVIGSIWIMTYNKVAI
ncbi:cytochrome o ubiquinol oxidase subunit IV [Paenibacillus montaniterrae]|uniref:Cytochrome o ubiquinol oxidase subunit IV n=1 Tax=Paenibacillus montaniterrae TaxID=429341 RepID=A0A919YUR7_9BACL|nr:cytochrome o ubiquinol oxidase subunit IV [Paenibacillus montaniterrae]GIP18824.1 cytochrome o ubiquinol oxidase subunit IV [Paenibacillus montaniterrae]